MSSCFCITNAENMSRYQIIVELPYHHLPKNIYWKVGGGNFFNDLSKRQILTNKSNKTDFQIYTELAYFNFF